MISILKNEEIFNDTDYISNLTDATNNQYHQHEFIEIFYVVSGKVFHTINGKKEVLDQSTLYLLRPNDFHNFTSFGTNLYIHRDICIKMENFKNICDFLSPYYFDTIINSRTPFKIQLASENIKFFEQQFNMAAPAQDKNPTAQNILYKSIISNILFFLFTQHSQLQQNIPVWLQHLTNLLQTPYNFTNTIPEILKEFHYTQPYICNCFKKYMGCTITDYFTKAKLTHASFLIVSTSLPISTIAEKAGYTDLSFFDRVFKARYGQTPMAVRKSSV